MQAQVGVEALLDAAEAGDVDEINSLLGQGVDVNCTDDNGCTSLLIASQNGHVGAVEVLIKAKAAVNQAKNNGATPLFIASQNGHVGAMKVLIKAKAAVDQANNNGATPLYIASHKGHVEAMKVLMVEDDAEIASFVKRGLEADGFRVDVAVDGVQGLFMATEYSYDLIVLDLMLPRKNGFVVCAELRDAEVWTPVLMLTAKDGDLRRLPNFKCAS